MRRSYARSGRERGVNIRLVGDFSSESLLLPQLDATSRLCAWLAQNLG